jgi:hypothetical protein
VFALEDRLGNVINDLANEVRGSEEYNPCPWPTIVDSYTFRGKNYRGLTRQRWDRFIVHVDLARIPAKFVCNIPNGVGLHLMGH